MTSSGKLSADPIILSRDRACREPVSKGGQVMKAMAGKANPGVVNELLKKALD